MRGAATIVSPTLWIANTSPCVFTTFNLGERSPDALKAGLSRTNAVVRAETIRRNNLTITIRRWRGSVLSGRIDQTHVLAAKSDRTRLDRRYAGGALCVGHHVEHDRRVGVVAVDGWGDRTIAEVSTENTASIASEIASDAVSVCPIIDLLEDTGSDGMRSPKTVDMARYSILSFSGVDVPWVLT